MNSDLLHTISSIAILAAIVALEITGHASSDVVYPLLGILGGQVGGNIINKLGAQKNEAKNV